ncbi:MAG: dephospho-CoA kinase [Acidobacteria bacterium]|nr:dephospho-CoA kinase [Acidobacteriota bacterium]
MIRVALTGGIATGKSYVAARLRDAGVPVIDADVVAREVVAPGTPGLDAVLRRFGSGVIAADGTLDRAALAAIVFADPAARRDLELIIHPAVRRSIDAFLAEHSAAAPFAVADIPLLFETGRERDFDVVVVAACPPEMQRARVMARDGATAEQAERRMAAQWPIADKVARADFVVDTSGTFADTDRAVDAVLAALRRRAAATGA